MNDLMLVLTLNSKLQFEAEELLGNGKGRYEVFVFREERVGEVLERMFAMKEGVLIWSEL